MSPPQRGWHFIQKDSRGFIVDDVCVLSVCGVDYLGSRISRSGPVGAGQADADGADGTQSLRRSFDELPMETEAEGPLASAKIGQERGNPIVLPRVW